MNTAQIKSIIGDDSFKILMDATNQYNMETNELVSLYDNGKYSDMLEVSKAATAFEATIMELLPTTVSVVQYGTGEDVKYVLMQRNTFQFVKLEEIKNPQTVAKFTMTLLRKAARATKFETMKEAEEQAKAANYAIFRGYLQTTKMGGFFE